MCRIYIGIVVHFINNTPFLNFINLKTHYMLVPRIENKTFTYQDKFKQVHILASACDVKPCLSTYMLHTIMYI